MSERSEAPTPQHRHALIGKIAEGITFVLFIGAIVPSHPVILASAALWTLLALGLPLFFRDVFTFAIPLNPSLDVDGQQPRSLSTLGLMSMALGIVGVIGAFRVNILFALGDAAVLGCILFCAALFVDPLLRTRTQIVLLAAQCVFWTLGARIAIVGLLNG